MPHVVTRKYAAAEGVPAKSNVKNTIKFLGTYKFKSVTQRNKAELAKWTKEQLIELGPTFIKIGQFVSSRSDLFDKAIIDELKNLQDNTPSFPAQVAKDIISEELKRPYNEIFSEFDDVPLASASISQVHRARLAHNNKEVVVKVQRPNIREYFNRDFTTLQRIMSVGTLFNDRSINDTKLLLDDCYKYLYEELSFENEIINLKKFRGIVKNTPNIVVPRPYTKFCSSRVITMEYIPSKKLSMHKVHGRESLAYVLMEFFFKQILEYGVIHADPHPGNIGITEEGKLVLYDFGQVTNLESAFTTHVRSLLFAVYEKDVPATSRLLVDSKAIMLIKALDKKQMHSFVSQVMEYFEHVDVKQFQVSMLETDMGIELPFKINPNLIMVFRSLTLLEGVCKELDPDFSYYKVINRMMQDVFLDMDYLDHRARKDLSMLLDTSTDSQMKQIQTVIETNNSKNNKTITHTMQRYQQFFTAFMIMTMFDASDLPKSAALIGAFVLLSVKLFKT